MNRKGKLFHPHNESSGEKSLGKEDSDLRVSSSCYK